MTFNSAAEVAAFFAGKQPTSAPALAAASSPRTAEAAPAAAPTPKAEPSPTPAVELTFKDLVAKLQAWSKKVSREDFKAKIMDKYGITRVPELEQKPETWAEIAALCA